jgi:hypothetical protein
VRAQLKPQYDFSHIPLTDEAVAKVLRRTPPAERIEMSCRFRRLLCFAIQSLHPDWSDAQVSRELQRGAELEEYPLFPEDIFRFCIEKAGMARTAQWADEAGLREVWDVIEKRTASNKED